MAEESGGGKRTLWGRVGMWLYSVAIRPGWPRRILLAAAVIIFILCVIAVRSGIDYRRDPSALVPRSARVFLETREIGPLLTNVGDWKIWRDDKRVTSGSEWLQVGLATHVGGKVTGLGTRLPLLWLNGAHKAAFAMVESDNGPAPSWALYLETPNASAVVRDIGIEAGLKLENAREAGPNIYTLTGYGEGRLILGVVEPWLIISSDTKLPKFAVENAGRTGFSIARADVLPDWRRDTSVRGVVDPAYAAEHSELSKLLPTMGGWLEPQARVGVSVGVRDDGKVSVALATGLMADKASGGGIWTLLRFILGIVAILCLILVALILLVMIGWGGWLRFAAAKAGIAPAKEPEAVEPSPAFKEDAGGASTPAALPAPPTDSAPVSGDSDDDHPADEPGLPLFPESDSEKTPIVETGDEEDGSDTKDSTKV